MEKLYNGIKVDLKTKKEKIKEINGRQSKLLIWFLVMLVVMLAVTFGNLITPK